MTDRALKEKWVQEWLSVESSHRVEGNVVNNLMEAWVTHCGSWDSLLFVIRRLDEGAPCLLLGSHLRDWVVNSPTEADKEEWETRLLDLLDSYVRSRIPANPAQAVAEQAITQRWMNGDFFPCDLITLRAFRGTPTTWDLPWDLIVGARTHRGTWDALQYVAPCIVLCLPSDPPRRSGPGKPSRACADFRNPVIVAVVKEIAKLGRRPETSSNQDWNPKNPSCCLYKAPSACHMVAKIMGRSYSTIRNILQDEKDKTRGGRRKPTPISGNDSPGPIR